ncbi:co-chaperone YbbN, partial [Amycolatopsis sp. NPDC000740]
MSAALSGAVDLSALKARAEASRNQPPSGAGQPDGAPAPSSDAVLEVTEATFQSVVELSLNQLVVVDLWAGFSEQCQQLTAVLERLAGESGGSWVLA